MLEMGVAGFDVDGTDEAVCGEPDRTAPWGQTGIDNQAVTLLPFQSMLGDLGEASAARVLSGEQLVLVEVLGVNDLVEDDCVLIRSRAASFPNEDLARATLDPDGNDVVDTIDPLLQVPSGVVTYQDPTACIHDGVLYARFGGGAAIPVELAMTEITVGRLQMRARMVLDDPEADDPQPIALDQAALGGVFTVDALVAAAEGAGIPGARSIVESLADTDETAEGCEGVSFAFTFQSIPVELAE
jgi:hypothetical protein